MWKKILIAALVFFLAGSYFMYNANEAMNHAEGDVANIQKLMETAADRNRELATEARDKSYAELRQEWFESETSRLQSEKSADDSSAEEMAQEITEVSTALTEAESELNRLEEELRGLVSNLMAAVGVEGDADDVSIIGETIVALSEELSEKQAELAKEKASVAVLEAEEARLKGLVEAGRKLNLDRQSRISPPELKCMIATIDPNWSYAILDAGLDKGIVIGSRLAVMRGDVKICELNVTLVEENRASADVVYSTLLPGEAPQAGDTVVSVRNDK